MKDFIHPVGEKEGNPFKPQDVIKDKSKMISVLKMTLVRTSMLVAEEGFTFIDTRDAMSEHVCNGHNGTLGFENPKLSVSVNGEVFLLCKACWKSQGIKER